MSLSVNRSGIRRDLLERERILRRAREKEERAEGRGRKWRLEVGSGRRFKGVTLRMI